MVLKGTDRVRVCFHTGNMRTEAMPWSTRLLHHLHLHGLQASSEQGRRGIELRLGERGWSESERGPHFYHHNLDPVTRLLLPAHLRWLDGVFMKLVTIFDATRLHSVFSSRSQT